MNSKAQMSIEVLVVLSILIVGGVIFGVYYINHVNQNIAHSEKTKQGMDNLVDDFVDSMTDTNITVPVFSAIIVSPTSDASFERGTPINFKANYSHNYGAVTCDWNSSIDGDITPASSTCDFSKSSLSNGNHKITLKITDTNTTLNLDRNITVSTLPFSIDINSPAPGTYYIGDSISFLAKPTNPSIQDYNCSWKSTPADPINPISTNCIFSKSFSTCGTYTIDVNATRTSTGDISTDNAQLILTSKLGTSIKSPSDGYSILFGESLNLWAQNTGNSGDVNCVWISSKSGPINNYAPDNCNFNYKLLSIGDHNITLAATDDCRTVQRSVPVHVLPGLSFVALISRPLQDQNLTFGSTYDFNIISNTNITKIECNWYVNDTFVSGHTKDCDPPMQISDTDKFIPNRTNSIRLDARNKDTGAQTIDDISIYVN